MSALDPSGNTYHSGTINSIIPDYLRTVAGLNNTVKIQPVFPITFEFELRVTEENDPAWKLKVEVLAAKAEPAQLV